MQCSCRDQMPVIGGHARESRLMPHPFQPMVTPFSPLSEEEQDELDDFLLNDVDTDEGMTLDMMDGFLHGIAIGPTTIQPKQWLPKVWGTKEMMPPMDSIERLNHVLG